ncbi:MAG TPA: rod shape-determining protein RodA [Acetobacteraceae bacterium]|nr:rod shape-determining protein RodA [Acetobacteraceae bacterium]
MITERRLLRAEPDFGLLSKFWQINWLYVLLLCALAGVGYVALYSAGGGPEPYASRHALRFAFGLVMMLCIAMIDIRFLARLAWPLYFGALMLLVLVLRMGHVGKGAERWLDIAGLQLQPSEMMKVALVMALASWFHKASWERVGNPLFLLPPAIAVLVPVALILKEPNLGTAVITAVVGASVFLGAGMRWWQIGVLAAPIPLLGEFLYRHLHDYQRARIKTFLNPESDPLGAGYNIIQSKIALGSGGLWGKGFMQGTQAHLNFLPEKQTDFIFSIIAEEWGLVGGLAVIGLLLLIILGGMAIGLRCRHQFGRLVALGISVNFFMYVFVNIAMVTGSIPVGGVPLPLVSHGGSAMLTVMFAFGLLMSVHVHRDVEFGERDEGV